MLGAKASVRPPQPSARKRLNEIAEASPPPSTHHKRGYKPSKERWRISLGPGKARGKNPSEGCPGDERGESDQGTPGQAASNGRGIDPCAGRAEQARRH